MRRGVLPELASHVILPRLAGLARAAELLLSGRTFLGDEAVEYGVARRALPREDVLEGKELSWAARAAFQARRLSARCGRRTSRWRDTP